MFGGLSGVKSAEKHYWKIEMSRKRLSSQKARFCIDSEVGVGAMAFHSSDCRNEEI